MTNQYNEDSIKKYSPLQFTRLRPDTYLGSNEDTSQLALELITNCIDEHLIGNCNEIYITINNDNSVCVRDTGQGILPNIVKDDGRTILEMVYGDINTSGKTDKSDKDSAYKVSTGAFGIGAALTNFLSHYLIATTKRDGQYETVYFKEGVFEKRDSGKCDINDHGVDVTYQPNEEFFVNAAVNTTKLKQKLISIACICPNLHFYFNDEHINHPEGITGLLNDKLGSNIEKTNSRCIFDIQRGEQKLNLGLTFNSKSDSNFIAFCNYGVIEAGTPLTTIKSCFTRTLNKWGQKQGILKDKENLTGAALQEGIILAFNLVSPNIRYDSQTKVRCTSTEDNPFINDVFSKQLMLWLDNNIDDGKIILESALVAKKAAEAAKKARAKVKAQATEKKDKVFKLPTKLTDCYAKDRSKCELLICEGKSAASGLVAARDSEFQAVYGVRGKMLSVLKSTPEKILANVEINNIIQALGLDYNPKTAKMIYNKSQLRYDKIIACADADPDGQAIENLLFNILWYLCPDLIIEGHVYSAVPPLFRITTKKNEYVYLRDADALAEYQKNNASQIKSIGRNKGLGEQDSEELSDTLLNPETRHVVQLQVNDIGATDNLFNDLYGKKVEPRVKFLLEHSEEGEYDYS